MTIATETARTGPYAGNSTTGSDGTSVFAYDFKVTDEAHLVITTQVTSTGVETVQVLTTNYTVSGVGDEGGGNVTMVSGDHPLTTETLTISRDVTQSQPTDLVNRAAVQPTTLETALDRGVQMTQDLDERMERTLKFAVSSDLSSFSTDVPTPVASKAIAINSSATGFELVDEPSASATAAAASANAAATSASNASTSASNASTSASNASTSETNAATSAAAAAAAAIGIYWKAPVKAATTGNITLSGTQTIDGISLVANDLCLVKNQTSTLENGIYDVKAGSWTRNVNMDTWDEHIGAVVTASEGSVNADTAWICTVDDGGTLETTAITWVGFGATGANYVVDNFADVTDYTSGTTTSLTLSVDPGSEENIDVLFDGLWQHHDTFSLSGTTLTFTSAIPLNTDDVEVKIGTTLGIGTPSDGTVTAAKLGAGAEIGTDIQAYDADTLKADTADVLTAGFATTIYNAGTKTTGTFTPDEANGNMQKAVNGGAHTLAVPANDCTMVIQYTNDGSAGTITTSGFDVVDGDTLTTTNGDDFFFFITNSETFTLLTVKALQ